MTISRFTLAFLLAAIAFLSASVAYMGRIAEDVADDLRFCRAQFTRQNALGYVWAKQGGDQVLVRTSFGWLVLIGEKPFAEFKEGGCAWHDGQRAFPTRCDSRVFDLR